MASVYVVTTYTPAGGGFEWFASEENALAFYGKEVREMRKYPRGEYLPIYIGEVKLPTGVKAMGSVTKWLDSEGRKFWDVSTCIEDTKP